MRPNYSAHVLGVRVDGTFLLVKRKDVPVWVIPGGTAEVGESPRHTAAREFFEETGVSVDHASLRLAVRYTPIRLGRRNKYTFIAKIDTSQQPKITHESSAFGFFSLDSLPSPISVYERERILDAYLRYTKKTLQRNDTVHYLREFQMLARNPILLMSLFARYIATKIWR